MQDQQFFSKWIERSLPSTVTSSGLLQLDALAGDAGFRRYFRVNAKPSVIAVNSPPKKEKNAEYVGLSLFLQSQGLITPKIHAVNFTHGYMLVEDFGYTLFSQQLELVDPNALYDQAETELLKIQTATEKAPAISLHDDTKIDQELALFEQWFLNSLLNYQLNKDEKALLASFFATIKSMAKEQPQVMIHADYHSRNLMIIDQGKLGIIDFQDAMLGAITYDLVSLLKDCYVRWPESWVIERALGFKKHLESAGLLADIADSQFLKWFDFMGLQRHIKVLGIFSRLALRDSKRGYLKDIPLVAHYCLEASSKYPQAQAFNGWFRQQILPLLAQQSWYSDKDL
ncbi:phosphotransferase [Porticoccaceae bacterium]|jgi:N-acetylmuramate 1-kinase|nr:phosphotransferase [Porticoccaceae bacterium]MDA9014099.1 phosphotransferase [Porticoccaceae bacterium]MDA9569661.1 phosphotransferase [Porticoccaceae bacterium]